MGRGCIAGCWRSLTWIPQVSPVKLCLPWICWGKPASIHIVWVFCCAYASLELSLQAFGWTVRMLISFLNFRNYLRGSVFGRTRLREDAGDTWLEKSRKWTFSLHNWFLAVIFESQTRELVIMRAAFKNTSVHHSAPAFFKHLFTRYKTAKARHFFSFETGFY